MAAMAGRGLAARGEEREQRPAAAAEEDERTEGRAKVEPKKSLRTA